MKYNISTEIVPQDKRKEINEKIIYLLNNNLCAESGITQQDVFDAYTGDGHLHGLNFKDFDNYHEFSEAKRLEEQGQFFSSPYILQFISQCIKPTSTDTIADLTSGRGDWFNFCPIEQNCYSNELDIKAYKVQKYLYPKVNIIQGDIRQYTLDVAFDIMFLNPPFSLNLRYKNEDWKSEMLCVQKASDTLKPAGLLALLVPQSFCNDDFMNKGDITFLNKHFNFICQFDLPNDSFKHVGIKYFPTKVMFLQKKSVHIPDVYYSTEKIVITDFTEETVNLIYGKYIEPALDIKHKLRHKLVQEQGAMPSDGFNYKIKKLKFDIGRHPKIKDKLIKCNAYLTKFYNQVQPEGVSYEEWEKSKITENKVLFYFRRELKKQNKIEKDVIKLIKTNGELKFKAYSQKSKIQLSAIERTKAMNINSMVYHNQYPFEDKQYLKVIEKKRTQFGNQSLCFKDMQEDINIKKWLENTTIFDSINDEVLQLNPKQQQIVNVMIQKKYGYIQASQGSGKTLMGIHIAMYRQQFQGIKNTFIVAPAIAIKGTWNSVLPGYNIPYIQISKRSDFAKIKDKDFVLLTFNMVCKFDKVIKKFIKQKAHRVLTIIDEADNICNLSSKRYKATMSATFKSKYKTCLSGTMARNNIAEAFTQLLWLYGSTYNFICDCNIIYKRNKEGTYGESQNEQYLKPFKMYKGGYSLFRNCYNPEKITIMGTEQQNQDIYNSDSLKALCNKTIITKSFEEIVGKKIYSLHQNLVPFSDSEQELYRIAIENFMDMKYLFSSTGNPRKDKMLEILQQLNLLLDICRFPQIYKEYNSSDLPNKFTKVLKMLDSWSNEYVAIGCRTLKEVDLYTNMIQEYHPQRELFIITGSIDIEQRKNVIKQLEQSKNGILLSTQQSLSSSVNIHFVNKAIITSIPWNYSTLQQYFFRFIRYNSTDMKEIHFVMYDNSLECNLLSLLMSKEKLVRFLKDDEIDNDQLNEEFGVDFDLLSMLLGKEKDNNNRVRINWGKSNL